MICKIMMRFLHNYGLPYLFRIRSLKRTPKVFKRHAGSLAINIEMQKKFQNFSGNCATAWSFLLFSDNGIIFHANKQPEYQRLFHVQMLKRKITSLMKRVANLENDIRMLQDVRRDKRVSTSNFYDITHSVFALKYMINIRFTP